MSMNGMLERASLRQTLTSCFSGCGATLAR
jgi:hypothetical protein